MGILLEVLLVRTAEMQTGMMSIPKSSRPSNSLSKTARMAHRVLERSKRAEDEAVHEAILHDTPSRMSEEPEQSGFRSWSDLYKWSVGAATEKRKPSESLESGLASSQPETLGRADLQETSKTSSDGGTDAGKLHELLVQSSAENGDRNQSTQADVLSRLEELERIGNSLPEFESEIVILEKAVEILKSSDNTLESTVGENLDDTIIDALETISELCHSGDNARDLHTLGGLNRVIRLLDDSQSSSSIHQASAKAISVCSQNNPPVAEAAVVDLGVVDPLLNHACAADALPATRARALMALVSLVDAPATRSMLNGDDSLAARVLSAIKLALENIKASNEHRRGALRALALAEGVVRKESNQEEHRQKWKQRFVEHGVSTVTEEILRKGNDHDGDLTEAAARLASAMDL